MKPSAAAKLDGDERGPLRFRKKHLADTAAERCQKIKRNPKVRWRLVEGVDRRQLRRPPHLGLFMIGDAHVSTMICNETRVPAAELDVLRAYRRASAPAAVSARSKPTSAPWPTPWSRPAMPSWTVRVRQALEMAID